MNEFLGSDRGEVRVGQGDIVSSMTLCDSVIIILVPPECSGFVGPGSRPDGIEWHKLEDVYLYALLDGELGCSGVGIWGIVHQGNIPVDGMKTRHELLNECPGQR